MSTIDAFNEKGISGFCLLDDEFPVIYLNNSTSKTRQVFSLFHELAHLLFHINGISKFDTSYIAQLAPPERRIEQFCNVLAAELLMPSADFDAQLREYDAIDERGVERLASRYSVSREVVFRRLLDKGLVTQAQHEEKAAQWAAQAGEREGSGGNYYATQATYLGERYLKLVFGRHYQGQLSLEQVADYLGVKTKSVAGLEEFALQGKILATNSSSWFEGVANISFCSPPRSEHRKLRRRRGNRICLEQIRWHGRPARGITRRMRVPPSRTIIRRRGNAHVTGN